MEDIEKEIKALKEKKSDFINKFISALIKTADYHLDAIVDDIGLTDKDLKDFYPWNNECNLGHDRLASNFLWCVFICILYGYPISDAKIKTWEDGRGMCFIFPNIRDFISKAKKRKFEYLPQNLNVVPIRVTQHGTCYSYRVISDKNAQKYTKDADVTSAKFQHDFNYMMFGAPWHY